MIGHLVIINLAGVALGAGGGVYFWKEKYIFLGFWFKSNLAIPMILCACQMIPCLVNIPSWKDMSGSTERYVGRSGMGRVVSSGSLFVGRLLAQVPSLVGC